jgi:AmiR/NasT family two-component response regulator
MWILIADDEPIIRMGLKSMLEEMGHQAIAAANGREALRHARRQQFDLAILDIRMPYTDGLQTAEALNRQHSLPILILTAYSDEELIERASDLPIQGYLVKPIEPAELGAAIKVAVKRHQESENLKSQTAAYQQKLMAQKIINQAKAKLMAAGMSEEEAHHAIHSQARDSQRPMHQVAREILKDD